jgi:hypothetical protein
MDHRGRVADTSLVVPHTRSQKALRREQRHLRVVGYRADPVVSRCKVTNTAHPELGDDLSICFEFDGSTECIADRTAQQTTSAPNRNI